QLVDEAGREERRRERRAALEQERLDAFRCECTQLVLEWTAPQLALGAFRKWAAAEREPPGLTSGADVAGVEARRVGTHGAHPHRHGVRAGAQLVHPAPRLFARHPAATRHDDPVVERHRDLVGDEGAAERLPDAPRLVLLARGEVVAKLDLDSCRTQAL